MYQVPTHLRKLTIDEGKQYGLHKLEENTATNENKKIYSDHNSILILNLKHQLNNKGQRR